ncbi:hypothetical protein [Microtetraspora glauca]|uniref:CheB-type methylesterase domain-containing protein n=1 Tax=Microtetraspora glauca TaxID=1996 RepID=A0ABV3GS79_MICGL
MGPLVVDDSTSILFGMPEIAVVKVERVTVRESIVVVAPEWVPGATTTRVYTLPKRPPALLLIFALALHRSFWHAKGSVAWTPGMVSVPSVGRLVGAFHVAGMGGRVITVVPVSMTSLRFQRFSSGSLASTFSTRT